MQSGLEVCTDLGLARGLNPTKPSVLARPTNEVIFPTERAGKGELNSPTGRVKEKRIILKIGFGLTKQRQNFKINGEKNNNVSDLGKNKCKCADEMCLSVFTTGL